MFDFKYQIKFKNGDCFNLFGEDFFGDKSTFWNAHQTSLKELYKKVVEAEFPIQIIDLQTQLLTEIETLTKFRDWLKVNQPFADSLQQIANRIEQIYLEIKNECDAEKTTEFEYYWEIFGVMWYPWTIEINNKSKSFSINDISQEDLNELEKLDKITLVKIYEKSEMKDEFDRKRYKINS